MGNPLERELAYYAQIRENLLKSNKDQFALIKREELGGTFTTSEEAYNAGIDKYGNVPFLVKEITENEFIHKTPALFI